MANKKIYKNRLSLPIFDNKGMGNGNGIAYVPNIIRGGSAIPIGNNMFFMKGKSHNQGGIDIGKDLEVERNEVVQNGKFGTRVFSSVPFLRGVSPAQRVLQGENPDAVFAAQENWKRINKINDDGSRKARKGKYITNPNVVQSDNTRVVPILNNTPKSKEIRQGDFIYTPKQLVVDDKKGFAWQPASRRLSQVPLERTYPEFDAFMLGRAIGTALSKDMQLRRAIDTSFENNKVINKNISPKVIKYSPKTNNENLKNIFDIKNDIDFYNAANEFANKYGYETFDKSLVGNRKALEDAVKQMLNRHNTFYRGVVGDDATKRIAVDTPWKEGEGIWITPQADYAQLYGQVGKLQRPYKLSSNRNNWFKDADFDYTFADDNVGLINPWQRNPKLYGDIIIDKSVPHEIYAKDKLNFVDWVKDIKNAKGSNNVMNYKKFGGRKAALGLSLFRPNSFKVQELPIDNFLANSINREIETPEVPTYVLKDDEKPVGKKVNPNVIGGGRLYNGYAVDNHEGENVDKIGGSRVYKETLTPTSYALPGKNKYSEEEIYNQRKMGLDSALDELHISSKDREKYYDLLIPQSVLEPGWTIPEDNNYFGHLKVVDGKRVKIRYANPKDAWLKHIKNLNTKWPNWITANNQKEYFDIINNESLGLHTLQDWKDYVAKNPTKNAYIYAPAWENNIKQYVDSLNSISNKFNKYKAFGGDKTYVAPKWAQDSYKKYGKVVIGGEPLGIGLGAGRVGTFTGLMRNNLLRSAFRNFKKYGSRASTIIKDSYYDLTDALAKPFIRSEKAYKTFKKVRGIGYDTFFGDRRLDGTVKTGKGDFEFFSNLSRLPITFNETNNIINGEKQFGGMKFKDRHKATWGDWIWNGLKAVVKEARKPSYQRTAPSWINSNLNDVSLTTPRVIVQPQAIKDWDTGEYLREANKLNSDVGREREIVQNYINDYRNKRRDVFLNDNIYGDNGSYDFHNKPFEFPNFKFERGYNIKNADIDNQVDDINEWNKNIVDFYNLRRKWREERNNRRGSIINQDDMRKYGGLSRSKDYGSKDKPYPSVNKNDFAGGGRSYPIPTRADAVDALRLAGLHHRSDVRAKVYAKYPDLRKKATMGTIDDEDVLEALRAGNVRNATPAEKTVEPVRTNYVERNNSSDNFGLGIGTILGGGAVLSGLGYAGNKLNNYFSEDAINGRRVAKILENQENIRQAYEDRPKVLGKKFGKELSRVRINTPISNESFDLTHRINYEEPINNTNKTASLEKRDAKIAAGVKAAKNKIKTDNANVAKAIKNSARTFKGAIGNMGRLFPAFAAIDFVINLFPSKQEEEEADKAWRRHKSPTGRIPEDYQMKFGIPEDYQMKFGGRKKAPYGTYITIGGRRVPLVFDTNNKLSDQVLSLMYPTIAAGTQNLPKDFNRLSLLNTNNIGTGGSLVHAVPNRQNSNGSYFPINFDRLSRADVQNLGLTPNFPSMGFDLRGMNDFTLNALFGNLKPKDIRNAQTLSDVARAQEASLNNPSRTLVYDVPDYTGNINGQEVVINPAYMRQVPKSVKQAFLNNTPEIVRGSNNTRRSVDVDNVLADSRPQFYAEENRNMYPEVNRNYGFRYGWSHGSTPNYGADIPASTAREARMIGNIDLSKYFNADGTPKSNPTRRTQPVSVRTERVGNIPGVYTENMKRPNLTQLGTQGIGLNMPAYINPFTPATTSGTRIYDIGVPTTLDTSRLDSTLSKYGVTPISSSTGVQPNPADVEAVRSGNFKAIDNDRYVPIHTTTEDWVGLGANLLGSIGSYLGTRNMLNHYPMPSKPVPAIAQKLKTRFNINSALDQIREQAGSLGRMVDNNIANSRVAQARKQGISNNATASANQQYNQKENIETQLINQDIMNRQRVGLYNNQVYNNWLSNRDAVRRYVANAKIGNFNNVLSGANQSIQDLLGRIESRDALGRNLIFMQAAYPNVNWRNIFQNNRELARSFGFRFLNN